MVSTYFRFQFRKKVRYESYKSDGICAFEDILQSWDELVDAFADLSHLGGNDSAISPRVVQDVEHKGVLDRNLCQRRQVSNVQYF